MEDQDRQINKLSEHLFRHEWGRIVAALSRIFGAGQIQLAEDLAQETLLAAMETWPFKMPENPQAWLYRVAKNKAVDYIRRQQHFRSISLKILSGFRPEDHLVPAVDKVFLAHELADGQLRMMFTICHPELQPESQIALILKTLSGFSVAEIAKAFLTTKSNINKRLFWARDKIRQLQLELVVPQGDALEKRLMVVLKAIYLIFNEGYNSSGSDEVIRKDLCFEAMRLCKLLSENEYTAQPETFALLALMCFHASRFEARLDREGSIILMKRQNRNFWDQELIQLGQYFLAKSATGERLSTYHLEARIASIYSLSADYQDISWKELAKLYQELVRLNPSPIIQLNRSIVLGKAGEKKKALKMLLDLKGLDGHYLYQAALGELNRELKKPDQAKRHYHQALVLTQTKSEKKLLEQKLKEL